MQVATGKGSVVGCNVVKRGSKTVKLYSLCVADGACHVIESSASQQQQAALSQLVIRDS